MSKLSRFFCLMPLLAAACTKPPPARHAPSQSRTASAAPAASTLAGPDDSRRTTTLPEPVGQALRLAWVAQLRPFSVHLSSGPNDQLALLSSGHLTIVGGLAGDIQAQRQTCKAVPGGFAFLSADSGAVVCEHSVEAVALDDLAKSSAKPLSASARLANFGGKRLAIAFADRRVLVFNTEDWTTSHEIPLPAEATAVALSDDGKYLAIATQAGGAALLDLADERKPATSIKGLLPITSLHFSQDGDRLFGATAQFSALWRVADGELLKRFGSLSGGRSAAWLNARELAVATPDGILLLDTAAGKVTSLAGAGIGQAALLVRNAASPVLCAAKSDGLLACFRRTGPAKRSLNERLPWRTRLPQGALEVEGRLSSRAKGQLRVAVPRSRPLPPAGAPVQLLGYFEAPLQDTRQAGWKLVSEGIVLTVKEGELTLKAKPSSVPQAPPKVPLTLKMPLKVRWKKSQATR